MALLVSLLALSYTAIAVPSIGLPINAQVPPVARTSKVFDFTFSESTFYSSAGTITYTTANAPRWLQLDTFSRTFSGTPGPEDAGAVNLDLIATDNTGSRTMPVTLVVSSSPGPSLGAPIEQQLASHDGYQSPDTIALLHSSPLSLSFSPDTFTDTSRDTVYYAICANNTPLPSWIKFDPGRLSFSGTAPQNTSPDELPQTFDIHIAASDVVGFSAAIASFRLVLEDHILVFRNQPHVVNITQDSRFTYDGLQTSLTLDGHPVDHSNIQQVHADKPDWVSFDEETWALSGVPPISASTQNVTVTVTDVYRENATATVVLQLATNGATDLFKGPLDNVSATIGVNFSYSFDKSLISDSEAELAVDLGPASWLIFDQADLELSGKVPGDLKPQQIVLNVTLSQGSTSQSERLVINIESATQSSNGRSTDTASTSTSSRSEASSPTSTTSSQAKDTEADLRAHRSRVAAAVAVPVVFVCLFLILASCFVHRKRRRRSKEDWLSATKRKISRPFLSDGASDGESVGQMVEKPVPAHKRASSRALITDLPGFRSSVASKRRSLLRLSRGTTDEASQAPRIDSWHEYIQGFDIGKSKKAAKPQFSLIPEEQTSSRREGSKISSRKYPSRGSKRSGIISISPSKRFRQKKRRSDMSFASSGVLSSQRMSGFGHGQMGSSFSISCFGRGPTGLGHGNGGPPGHGLVRKSWRHPSIDSWTPTDSTIKTSDLSSSNYNGSERSQNIGSTMRSFPRPPTSGTLDHLSQPPVIHGLEDNHRAQRASVRPVEPAPPQTYGLPLHTFHKRRARNRHHRNTFFSAGPSSRASSHLDWIHSIHAPVLSPTQSLSSLASRTSKKRARLLARSPTGRTYSQSSFEPRTPTNRRPSPTKPRLSPCKRTSGASNGNGNGGGGFATLISSAIASRFHSSKSSLASSQRFGSAAGSDIGLSPGAVGLEEERDEEGNRRWRHVDVHPNPLGAHTPTPSARGSPDTKDEREQEGSGGRRESPYAGMGRAMQRLSWLRQQADGRQAMMMGGESSGRARRMVVGGSRGKRPVSVDNGLVARGPSMKGDVVGEEREREIAFL
ncbi:MAG: hypothetical protein Q9201_007903 [Fulgogasparrea decipioides]